MKNETSAAVQVVALNEVGVQLMNNHNYSRANSAFTQGTLKIKQTLHLMDCQNTFENGTGSGCLTVVFLDSPHESSSMSKTEDRQVESQQPFIFNCPLSIVATTRDEELDTTSDSFITLASVLIYNHALSIHLSALDHQAFTSSTAGSNISSQELLDEKLRNALALYQCAAELMSTSSGSTNELCLMEMALLNNLGSIHVTLKNTKDMQDCFLNLMVLLDLAKKEESNNNNSDNLLSINGQNVVDAFMVNIVSFVLIPNAIFQAAAA